LGFTKNSLYSLLTSPIKSSPVIEEIFSHLYIFVEAKFVKSSFTLGSFQELGTLIASLILKSRIPCSNGKNFPYAGFAIMCLFLSFVYPNQFFSVAS
jgi:hypothetical protein